MGIRVGRPGHRRLAALLSTLVVAATAATSPVAGTSERAATASAAPDPRVPGPHEVAAFDYHFGLELLDDPSLLVYAYPADVRGSVHAPGETAAGPRPVVVLMHGRHGTCHVGPVEVIFVHVCPETGPTGPVESFRGYDLLAANLASHGYVVVSIDANHVNDHDLLGDYGAHARGQLLLRTLDDLAAIHAAGTLPDDTAHATGAVGEAAMLEGRLDLTRIGVMGHSRGGQGVADGAGQNAERPEAYGIRAILAVAPTSFDHAAVVAAPFATILPYCDGDVFNLQGAWMYDNGRHGPHPRHQFTMMGANHNWFNSVWLGSDQASSDVHCADASAGRLELDEQLEYGVVLMGAFLRRYVGDETAFAPLLDGRAPWPEPAVASSVDRGRDRLGHPATVLTSYLPGADERRTLVTVGRVVPRSGDEGEPLRVDGTVGACVGEGCGGPTRADAGMLRVEGEALVAIDLGGEDLRPFARSCVRVALPPDRSFAAAGLTLEVVDGHGASATLAFDGAALHVRPGGTQIAQATLDMVCVDLRSASGVDRSRVAGLALHVGGLDVVGLTDWQLLRR